MDAQPLTRTQSIHLWVQIVGIIAAGLWGAWVFIVKEIRQPAAAPVNVSLELGLSDRGLTPAPVAGQPNLLAVELQIAARNPSPRSVQLFPSMFVVSGQALKAPAADFDQQIKRTPRNARAHRRSGRPVPADHRRFGGADGSTPERPRARVEDRRRDQRNRRRHVRSARREADFGAHRRRRRVPGAASARPAAIVRGCSARAHQRLLASVSAVE